jgi:hypothetical protein
LTAKEREDQAIAMVKKYHPSATNVYISSTCPLQEGDDGTLIYVTYSQLDTHATALIYFPQFGDPTPYDKSEDFIRWYAARPRSGGFWGVFLEKVGGVVGIIGLVITLAICWEFIHAEKFDVPPILANSLSSIIGFYIGTKTTRPTGPPAAPSKD